jgi:hypothetical protein
MPENAELADEHMMSPPAVSEFLDDISESTLAQWRYLGKGPRFYKCGKHVRYRRADVIAWLELNAVDPRGH